MAARERSRGATKGEVGATITPAQLQAMQSEESFVDAVIELAQRCGWLVHHDRPARTSTGWRTAIQGDDGFPDLLLAREGELLLWEAKSEKGKTTPNQDRWASHLPGTVGYIIRPSDWDWIVETLR